ncbi:MULTISPECIES: bacteriocin-associated integral membrane family protein [unclassified Streptococcus]|uniref:bacteriocin-associated integral membrane family protein n=1 Tax=unclassified Streptococcus TaxID=2608887 RepID=UPI001071B314|nr:MULTISPECIES: DUF1430 domain-containing protein [unclassified Streptococcus]MBF0788082.1 bacteriocin-associated integral membrane family protein [Streptococcus sp. 19428wC2_LYSM12]MCQ9211401.1 DUF1430 domain-containing protein [Streptococcus sp. B01]MCQ9214714.1 DUF1430 domain-containing protein [Streptococcus sp. O1]TFV04895.1 bacteriocin-associated integral membrane family protein [Streptococcus sp. LYSM12]
MRRIFIFLSTLLLCVYIVIRIDDQRNQLVFSSYDAVDLIGTDGVRPKAREDFTRALNELAESRDSVIARRIVEPNEKGETYFAYEIYGRGKLPESLNQATEESARNSDLVNSYLIVSGSVTTEELVSTMGQLGYKGVSTMATSAGVLLLVVLYDEVFFLSLILLILTFVSLTLIYRIKDLRSTGLKRLAGQSFGKVMWDSFFVDVKAVSFSYLVTGFIGVLGLYWQGLFQDLPVSLLCLGLGAYSLFLMALSLFLSFVYLFGLKTSSLVEILKGRLPLKRLLSLMLVGQLASVLVVGYAVHHILLGYKELQTLEISAKEWDEQGDYYQMRGSYSSGFTKGEEEEKRQKVWYDFAQKAIEEKAAIFVSSNVRDFFLAELQGDVSGARLTDYAPEGNTLYVSPNYLEAEHVEVSRDFLAQMKDLKEGEFGLLLPQKLQARQEEFEKIYSEHMSSRSLLGLEATSLPLFQARVYTAIVKDGQERFLYNNDESAHLQYLEDPILVVMTPKAMGDTVMTRLFWSVKAVNSLHLKGYQDSIELLKEQGAYHWVSYLLNDRLIYYKHLAESRSRFFSLLIGSFLGLATSVLLFDCMNLIYFEQFRREIFIKRLAGLRFDEIHFSYLLAQMAVLALGNAGIVYLTQNIAISVLTTAVFLANLLLILYRQTKAENRAAVTILKGK